MSVYRWLIQVSRMLSASVPSNTRELVAISSLKVEWAVSEWVFWFWFFGGGLVLGSDFGGGDDCPLASFVVSGGWVGGAGGESLSGLSYGGRCDWDVVGVLGVGAVGVGAGFVICVGAVTGVVGGVGGVPGGGGGMVGGCVLLGGCGVVIWVVGD
eukprot:scaffold27740_cov24-Attheya_sp.AAC.1